MAEDDQALPQFQQRSARGGPDRTVLRLHEWRGARFVEIVVQYSAGGFHLYELTASGAPGEPLSQLRDRVAQRLTLYDFHESADRKPPLLVLDIRNLDSLKLSPNSTVLNATVEVFCFFGVIKTGTVLMDLELRADTAQVLLTKLEVIDTENGYPNNRAGISAPIALSAAAIDSSSPANLPIALSYDYHFPNHFLKDQIGLDVGPMDSDLTVNRGKWQLQISFPRLATYLSPTGAIALPPQRNFRTIRFDLTTHKFSGRSAGKLRLAGFLNHQAQCDPNQLPSAGKSIPAEGQTELAYRNFPASFIVTQRAPVSIGAAPIPPVPGATYIANQYILHLPGVEQRIRSLERFSKPLDRKSINSAPSSYRIKLKRLQQNVDDADLKGIRIAFLVPNGHLSQSGAIVQDRPGRVYSGLVADPDGGHQQFCGPDFSVCLDEGF